MLPSLFIAHGSPMLALEDNEYTQFLRALGQQLGQPSAIVLFSAHWLATPQRVSGVEQYETLYDFGGFPDALSSIKYPATGDTARAQEILDQLNAAQIPAALEERRGLDHGAWVVLRMLYPQAEIPVVAMSVNPQLSPAQQYRIGQVLSALREDDVLFIGSGGTVHNLARLQFSETATPAEFAVAFDEWLDVQLQNWDLSQLFAYATTAPSAQLAVPPGGSEHFVPLFYAMGAADASRTAHRLTRSYRYGSLSHSVWQFG